MESKVIRLSSRTLKAIDDYRNAYIDLRVSNSLAAKALQEKSLDDFIRIFFEYELEMLRIEKNFS